MIVIALAIVSVLLRLSYWADREYAIIIYFASGAFFISIFNVALWWGGRPPSHPSIALVEILALTGMAMLGWRKLHQRANHPAMTRAHESSGIYRITCRPNKKHYIGQTSQAFFDRWDEHRKKFRSQRHHNRWMQADWDRYGVGAFTFEVLEIVTDPRWLLDRERWWQDKDYNAALRYNPPNIAKRR